MLKGYYFITDDKLSAFGNEHDVRLADEAGVAVVQYRAKGKNTRELLAEAKKLKKICRVAKFLINDRIDIAIACDADGVHLGQDDMDIRSARMMLGNKKIIGITVHNIEEALSAQAAGADYLGVSPIFETRTKLDAGRPAGLRLINEIRSKSAVPIAAIGGINISNALDVINSGADMVCAISAVVSAGDMKSEINKFQKLFGI